MSSFITRKGKRAPKRQIAYQTAKAYKSATLESGSRYDGSHGFRNAKGEWQTYVSVGRLKATEPLARTTEETLLFLEETEQPIQTEVVLFPTLTKK